MYNTRKYNGRYPIKTMARKHDPWWYTLLEALIVIALIGIALMLIAIL